MDKEAHVYIDLDGKPQLVGRLWGRVRKERRARPSNTAPHGSKTRLAFRLNLLCSLVPVRFTRPATCRCSGLSATQRPIDGAGFSCGGWNAGGPSGRRRRRAHSGRSTICCSSTTKRGRGRCVSQSEREDHSFVMRRRTAYPPVMGLPRLLRHRSASSKEKDTR